jgi:hypothetical protein
MQIFILCRVLIYGGFIWCFNHYHVTYYFYFFLYFSLITSRIPVMYMFYCHISHAAKSWFSVCFSFWTSVLAEHILLYSRSLIYLFIFIFSIIWPSLNPIKQFLISNVTIFLPYLSFVFPLCSLFSLMNIVIVSSYLFVTIFKNFIIENLK